MDPPSPRHRRTSRRLPRTRGDGPCAEGVERSVSLASPHTRGWTPHHAFLATAVGRLPRTRGDGPTPLPARSSRRSASPHTRGWTPEGGRRAGRAHGFPAHAGMDPGLPDGLTYTAGLPRTRGDGPSAVGGVASGQSASPHTRGWTRVAPVGHDEFFGFPAHAGMDPPDIARRVVARRLPRTRGDGPLVDHPAAREDQASPHTRGWTPGRRRWWRRWWGFPAHAGMDPHHSRNAHDPVGLPRTRGDGPPATRPGCAPAEASPHTRGWTWAEIGGGIQVQGFPAHAGMDPGQGPPQPRWSRLPRTRGDGPVSLTRHMDDEMASPHTRGWTR